MFIEQGRLGTWVHSDSWKSLLWVVCCTCVFVCCIFALGGFQHWYMHIAAFIYIWREYCCVFILSRFSWNFFCTVLSVCLFICYVVMMCKMGYWCNWHSSFESWYFWVLSQCGESQDFYCINLVWIFVYIFVLVFVIVFESWLNKENLKRLSKERLQYSLNICVCICICICVLTRHGESQDFYCSRLQSNLAEQRPTFDERR